LITGIIGILMRPGVCWQIRRVTFTVGFWLFGRLGSIAGVLIVDYWLVRKKRLELGDLYRKQGVILTTAVGTGALSWPL